jgi:hypothetical protein
VIWQSQPKCRTSLLRLSRGRLWHVFVRGLEAGAHYDAVRMDGPFDPAAGHRFNRKLIRWIRADNQKIIARVDSAMSRASFPEPGQRHCSWSGEHRAVPFIQHCQRPTRTSTIPKNRFRRNRHRGAEPWQEWRVLAPHGRVLRDACGHDRSPKGAPSSELRAMTSFLI